MTKKLFLLLPLLCSLPMMAQAPSSVVVDTVSASDFIPGVTPYIDVRSKNGAVCDGLYDDTLTIQAKVNAANRSNVIACGTKSVPAAQNCSSAVFIPAFCVVSQIVLPSRVILMGAGWQVSGLIQKPGSNKPMIVLADPVNTERVAIRGLSINGNKTNQMGAFDCILFDNTGATYDRYHELSDLYLDYCGANAITFTGATYSASHSRNIYIRHSGGYGVYSNSYDNWFDGMDVAMNGKDGIYFDTTAGNNHLGTSKTWFNHGFGVAGKSNRLHLVGVEAQDNYADGFDLEGDGITGSALSANGNGKNGAGTGSGGYKVNGMTNSQVSGIGMNLDEGAGTLTQDFGVVFSGAESGNTINIASSKENVADVNGTPSLTDSGAIGRNVINPPAVAAALPVPFGFQGFSGAGAALSGSTHIFYSPVPITITEMDVNASAAPVGCATFPKVAIYVGTNPATASACVYSYVGASYGTQMACSVAVAAKQAVTVKIMQQGVTCTGNLGTVWPTIWYKTQ